MSIPRCFIAWLCVAVSLCAAAAFAELDRWRGAVDTNGVTVNPQTLPVRPAAWMATPPRGDVARVARPCRIVDYGDDRVAYHNAYGVTRWRGADSPMAQTNPFRIAQDVDVNRDGSITSEFVQYIPYSGTMPLSAPAWPYSAMLPEEWNQTFYGGAAIWHFNSVYNPKGRMGFLEIGINPNHSGPYEDARNENHPISAERDSNQRGNFIHAAWMIFWKKEDFMNGGARYPVTFDDTSRLASVIGRGYWWGFDDIRFVVQDGETWYIADNSSYGYPERFAMQAGFSSLLYMIRPTRTTWAVFTPPAEDAPVPVFVPVPARFTAHTFKDIRAVGWYLAKTNDLPCSAHVKWYSFACDAVVQQPDVPSLELATVAVPATTSVPAFAMAKTEIPYRFWKRIFRWADSPVYTLAPRYIFEQHGDMGSMQYGDLPHDQDEPVTAFSFYDALAWCNALSEMEGKTPCYYTDPEHKQVFRYKELATLVQKIPFEQWFVGSNLLYRFLQLPTILVQWAANGWRLPTQAEWEAAAGTPTGAISPTNTTAAVGSDAPNALGLYGLAGNVWEWLWTHGDAMPPAPALLTAIGGDFRGDNPTAQADSPLGYVPYRGAYNIGFRPVCRAAGLPAPALGSTPTQAAYAATPVPLWSIARDARLGVRNAQADMNPRLPMITLPGGAFTRAPYVPKNKVDIHLAPFAYGATPITYAQWNKVRQWAEAHGYTFTVQGAMGSMWNFDFPHRPDEPVVNITWHDALIWCNALSEMQGLNPVYFTDETRTNVYRNAFRYRPIKISPAQYCHLNKITVKGIDYPDDEIRPFINNVLGSLGRSMFLEPWLYADWSHNGYRLPTIAEFEFAARAGTSSQFFWGGADTRDRENDYAWTMRNAGGRTHPVARKKPNPFGFYDILGNVTEWSWSTPLYDRNVFRPTLEDIVDPKAERMWGATAWRIKPVGFTPPWAPAALGCSWFWGAPLAVAQSSVACEMPSSGSSGHADLGLRVARSLPAPFVTAGGTTRRIIGATAAMLLDKQDQQVALAGELIGTNYMLVRDVLSATNAATLVGTVALAIAHPRDGNLPMPPKVFAELVPVKQRPYHALQGACFRGNLLRTGVLDADGPQAAPTVAWATSVGGPVRSSPVVVRNTVIIGGGDGIYALDAATGAVKWKFPSPKGSQSSACVVDDVVYIGAENGTLLALDLASGKPRWRARLGGGANSGIKTAPAVAFGVVLVSGAQGTVAVDATTGKKVWEYNPNNTPQLRVRGGAELGEIASLAVAPDGLAFGTFGTTWGAVNSVDIATSLATMDAGHLGEEAGFFNTVVYADGMLYFMASRGVYAFDTRTGTITWRARVMKNVGTNDFRTNTSPAYWSGLVFAGFDDGCFYAFDAGKSRQERVAVKWKFETGTAINSSPTIAAKSGTVYFGCDNGTVYAFNATTGAPVWQHDLGAAVRSTPWVAGKLLFVGCNDGKVYCLK
jgi:formylglycine-generating enzyme required for sulfatase activity/outer membrane protein assembly factor BamB